MHATPVDILQAIAGQDLPRALPSSIGEIRSSQALRPLFKVELLPDAHILEFIPRDPASEVLHYGNSRPLRSFVGLTITGLRITPVHLFNRHQREAAEI